MFKRVKPHRCFLDSHGEEWVPVATLIDRGTNNVCHVVEDDGCYVAYLAASELGFVPTFYLFPELHEALCALPALYTDDEVNDVEA